MAMAAAMVCASVSPGLPPPDKITIGARPFLHARAPAAIRLLSS